MGEPHDPLLRHATSPAGIQWVQVNVTGGNVGTTPIQQQIYPGATDGLHRWMGSVAVDKLGDMALGYSVSSATLNPDIRYAGRLAGDPARHAAADRDVDASGRHARHAARQLRRQHVHRWGDYSAMTIDPDGCDFWFTTEYYSTTGMNWQTRIGSFRLNPSCTPSGGGGGSRARRSRSAPLPDKVYGDADFTVSATASSGLPVSFSATGELHGLGQHGPSDRRRLVHDHGLAGAATRPTRRRPTSRHVHDRAGRARRSRSRRSPTRRSAIRTSR